MTRKIHCYSRTHLYPENMRKRVMPVVFNTYSCIRGAQVTEKNVLDLIPKAAEVGCELFIIDAGWQKSMGDWEINREKFPGGFKKIIESVKAHGMEFGLWVEFERADRTSRIYREHPEYLIDHNSYSLLNFALPEVVEYVYQTLRNLLIENDIIRSKYVNCHAVEFKTGNADNDRRFTKTYILGGNASCYDRIAELIQ